MASYPGLGCFSDEQMFEWLTTKLEVECVVGPNQYDLTLQFTPFPEPALNWMKKHLKNTKRNHRKTLDNIVLIPFILNHHPRGDLKELNRSKRAELYELGHEFGYPGDNIVPEAIRHEVFSKSIRERSIYYYVPDLCSALTTNSSRSVSYEKVDTALGTWPLRYWASYWDSQVKERIECEYQSTLSYPLYFKNKIWAGTTPSHWRNSCKRNGYHHQQKMCRPGWKHLPIASAKAGFYILHNFLDYFNYFNASENAQTNYPYTIRNFKDTKVFDGQTETTQYAFSIGFVIAYGNAFYHVESFLKNYLNINCSLSDHEVITDLKKDGYPVIYPSNIISLKPVWDRNNRQPNLRLKDINILH